MNGNSPFQSTYLGVLGFGDLNERLSRRVDNIEHLHHRRAVIRDGHRGTLSIDQLVHTARTQSRANYIDDSLARIDVANELGDTLRGISALAEQNDARLLS